MTLAPQLRRLLSLAGLFWFAASAAGQNWYDRVWQTDDGLPDNVVTDIAQTPDGFLWIGTQSGLMRFDGVQFESFSPINIQDVPNRTIRALLFDDRGRFWVGMDRGVVTCVDHNHVQVFGEKEGLPGARVRVMVEDAEGAIWIAYTSWHGVSRIKDGRVEIFDTRQGVPAGGGQCWLASDVDGRVWFSRAEDVGMVCDGKFKTLVKLEDPPARIARARGGGIWIGTTTRLYRCGDDGRLQMMGLLPQQREPGVLFEDRSGAVWIGTTTAYGLFRFDGSQFETVHLSNPSTSCIAEDREGNLWVGTGGGGLNRLRPQILELVNIDLERPFESVRSFCEAADGSIWAVTHDGLMMRRQGTNLVNLLESADWPGGHPSCVAAGPDGSVWIGTRGSGLYRFKDGEYTVWRGVPGLNENLTRALLVGANGDVWIGVDSNPRRLLRFHAGEFHTFNLPSETRSIRAMAEDVRGDIWTATAEGTLLRVHGDEVINATTNDLPNASFSIRCLHATADGSLWIGYAGWGLGRLKDGKYSRITTAQGLDDDYVSQIITDHRGGCWLGGGHGFYRLPLPELNDVMAGRGDRVHSTLFGRGEGVRSLQANYDNYPSVALGRDGCPRIGTRTGLAVIHMDHIRENPDPPPVVVTRMAIDGQTVALYDAASPLRERDTGRVAEASDPAIALRLKPNHRKIDFDFTALSFTAPENVQFRYRLEGFDEDWIDGGAARSAGYSRLPAGDYRFRVVACNNSSVWNERGATLAFTVLPFVWQRWWFRAAVIAAFTLTVIAIVRYVSFRRLRWQLRALEQQAALDKERTRIARDLHDDLGGSLTQVALLLDLNQKDFPGAEPADGGLRRCSAVVRQVVKSVDEIIWAINPRNDNLRYLVDYISQFAVEFLHAARIRCRVELPDRLPDAPVSPEVRHNLFLVVKEALNNVARHAQAGQVDLRVQVSERDLDILIADDGKGFPSAPDNALSDGLRNMRQRMEEIGGRFAIESRPGGGTRVSLGFSWAKAE